MDGRKTLKVNWNLLFIHLIAYAAYVLTVTFSVIEDDIIQTAIRYTTAIWSVLIGLHMFIALGFWDVIEGYLIDKYKGEYGRDR